MWDIFVGSASVFILLGRTSGVNSPKNKIRPNALFVLDAWGGGSRSAGGGGIPRCRVESPSRGESPNAVPPQSLNASKPSKHVKMFRWEHYSL